MNRDGIRARLERLLSGQLNAADVSWIFAELRFAPQAGSAFRDIADFAFHREDRDRGEAFRGLSAIDDMIDYHLPNIAAHNRAPRPPSDIEALSKSARAALDLSHPDKVKDAVGIPKSMAIKQLKRALTKIEKFDGTSLKLNARMTKREQRVFDFYRQLLVVQPRLNDQALFNDIVLCLTAHGLVSRENMPRLESLRPFLALVAVQMIHGTHITMRRDRRARLSIFPGGEQRKGLLGVSAEISADYLESEIRLWVPVFDTNVRIDEWCDKPLRSALQTAQFPSTHLEVREGKLRLIPPAPAGSEAGAR